MEKTPESAAFSAESLSGKSTRNPNIKPFSRFARLNRARDEHIFSFVSPSARVTTVTSVFGTPSEVFIPGTRDETSRSEKSLSAHRQAIPNEGSKDAKSRKTLFVRSPAKRESSTVSAATVKM